MPGKNRQELTRFRQFDFRGGVNQEIEEARENQLEDARNVWARFGELRQRPGYVPVTAINVSESGITASGITDAEFLHEDNSGASPSYTDVGWGGSFQLLNWDVDESDTSKRDRLYIGVPSGSQTSFSGVAWNVNTGATNNTQSTKANVEYWNGSAWQGMSYQNYHNSANSGNAAFGDYYMLTGSWGTQLWFLSAQGNIPDATESMVTTVVVPDDWAQTTVNSLERFWIRITLVENAPDGTASHSTGVGSEFLYSDEKH